MKLALKVIPNAKKSEAAAGRKTRGRAHPEIAHCRSPVEGKANKAVILFLASWLGIPKSSVILLRGETGRLKVVELPEECAEKLSRLAP